MFLSESQYGNVTMASIYVLIGVFFTFFSTRHHLVTCSIFGFMAAAFSVELWIRSIHKDYLAQTHLTHPTVFHFVLQGSGHVGIGIVLWSDRVTKLATMCVPLCLAFSFVWRAWHVIDLPLFARDDPFQIVCNFTCAVLFASVFLCNANAVHYEMYYLAATCFFGSYLFVAGMSLWYRWITKQALIRITPADVMRHRTESYYRADDSQYRSWVVVYTVPLFWVVFGLCGIRAQYAEFTKRRQLLRGLMKKNTERGTRRPMLAIKKMRDTLCRLGRDTRRGSEQNDDLRGQEKKERTRTWSSRLRLCAQRFRRRSTRSSNCRARTASGESRARTMCEKRASSESKKPCASFSERTRSFLVDEPHASTLVEKRSSSVSTKPLASVSERTRSFLVDEPHASTLVEKRPSSMSKKPLASVSARTRSFLVDEPRASTLVEKRSSSLSKKPLASLSERTRSFLVDEPHASTLVEKRSSSVSKRPFASSSDRMQSFRVDL